jgi:predicted transcriptional regulator
MQNIITHLRARVCSDVLDNGTSVRAIAQAVGFSQPQVRAFSRDESDGSGLLLSALAAHYGLQLATAQKRKKGSH